MNYQNPHANWGMWGPQGQYAPGGTFMSRGWVPPRQRGRRYHRMMQAARRAEMERQAQEAEYLRAGWGEPGWALQYAGQDYFGSLEDDLLEIRVDQLLAEEDALDAQDEDFGALTVAPAVQSGAVAHGGGAIQDLGAMPGKVDPPSTFVESMKSGAGFGIGFMGVMIGLSVLTGGGRR